MKFEAGKLYRTRDGLKAQIFFTDRGDELMLGAIHEKGVWTTSTWGEKGNWGSHILQHRRDLVSEWRERIKYSVELWGTEFAPVSDTMDLQHFVFGYTGKWSERPISTCPIKYRVTVEEIVEEEKKE